MTNQTTDKPDAGFEEFLIEKMGPHVLAGGTMSIHDAMHKAWQARQPEINHLKNLLKIREIAYDMQNRDGKEIERLKQQVEVLRDGIERAANSGFGVDGIGMILTQAIAAADKIAEEQSNGQTASN